MGWSGPPPEKKLIGLKPKPLQACHEDEVRWLNDLEFGRCLAPLSDLLYGYVIEDKGRVFAFLLYEHNDAEVLWIDRLMVMPAFRRQGYGSALVARLEKKLQGSRRKRMSIFVPDWMKEAHLFLQSLGFRGKLPIAKSVFPDGSDGYHLLRERVDD